MTRLRLLLLVLALLLLLSCAVSLAFGSAQVPLERVLAILGRHLFGIQPEQAISVGQDSIVWQLRAPRVLLGALVGAGLALVGTVLQAVTRNPLADPHLLGVSSGAAFGAVVVVLYLGEFAGVLSLPLAAFVGALASMLLVLLIANRGGRLHSDRLLLAGVAVSFVMMAASNLLLYLGNPHAASSVLFWMLGGLGLARWELLWLPTLCLALALLVLLGLARALNGLMAGEQSAVSLGLEPRRVRLLVFVVASLLTGVLVSLSGAIGFVGLMLPHVARFLVGAEHRRVLPVAALLGALFLVWVDVAARTWLAPQDLPIGIVTAAIGGVFFVALLRRR
ncbi:MULTISPECIES: iron ABC transporter permease [Pseudomonas]|uniref:Iron-dicitrate transporter subunit membrane component of ABC superfamily KpLE2 phage-like element n=1 Tax=Ectopseudomonas oleovorans TaxID=301 RepID=A0A653B4I0_ECTOL|nr:MULTISPECIES: iron ABC transporter permease [Pseudomonas]TNF19545.1 MAG: iron ABC transporter permease [Pseudomonadales bacterium]CAE6965730.1 ferric citrate ABC transporter membrane subunit FecC [Pseudomonas oleovorans]QFT24706.1 Hemin transport system permease protein HmuU [Pseudomonas sp. THAF187a]QFT44893.1 Hemin transport system permease protein HmuU [Pseudomonas sp. THAF42]QTS86522.1 iron ABC transporter permease [Pseudomonas khazarica]